MATGSSRGPPPSSTTLPEMKSGCSEVSGGAGVLGIELERLEAPVFPDFCAAAACTRRDAITRIQMRCWDEMENMFALRSSCQCCSSTRVLRGDTGNRAILRLNL